MDVDEVDIAVLDALHVNPRASFDEIGRVLDISGVTAARRWRRLVDGGYAWVSSAIGPRFPAVGALLEAECEPGAAQSVADRLAAIAQVFSVHITTGRYNVYALVAAADQPGLARLLIDVLPGIPAIRSVQTATVFQMFSGTYWRLGAISARQAREVAPPAPRPVRHVFDEFDRRLYLSLQRDGRLSYRDLAAELGRSETSVRRRLEVLTGSGSVTFRADFARAVAGWPTSAVLTLRLASDTAVADVGRALVPWPETRVCAAIIGGPAHLFVTVQVHEAGALAEFSARLHETFPGATVLSTQMVLRPVKSFGRLLDADGRARDMVPVDPWAPIPASA
ncbi:Lrp/AsnC family transcriptional regulator [Mycobacterium heidelbergense]|uniref:Lrp/AsnC family transcriptional regulator n=1 Tax=Mycobacterium heidelbergense TaxID=53376 RepID=UPI0009F2BD70|nr:AsnC family transcriptional regulator [Mycobacterium heidelbergense]MCV7052051.1 Lrp/AsnC family transcriptional regulator [Mycobacterium heidelbergense]BBZ48865.1 AsnC family transcriptional regulator [Mycobacterium heidelbergense]